MLHAELLHRWRGWLGAERRHPQRRQVISRDVAHVLLVLHHGLQECDASLEDRDAMPLDDRGEAAAVREDGRAFGHHARHLGRERGRDHVALPSDPAGIGDDVDHVARPRIERHTHRGGNAGGVAAMHVHHALGLSRRARRVDEEKRELGVERPHRRRVPDHAHEVRRRQCKQRRLVRRVEALLRSACKQDRRGGVGQRMAP